MTPVSAAVAALLGLFANRIVGRRPLWLPIVLATIAIAPIGMTALTLQDHVSNGPHNGDAPWSGLNQIGLGLMLYAIDHDHMLPPDLSTMVRFNHGPSQRAFVNCFGDTTLIDVADPETVAQMIKDPAYCAFIYVGGGHKDDGDPDTIVAYSREPNYRQGCCVLFGDGHSEEKEGEMAETMSRLAVPNGRVVHWSDLEPQISPASTMPVQARN